jgi:hypothetical protein
VKTDKVYLVGFMGAGKTTVARALARKLDWRAVDIDEAIEQREHDTVASIFAKKGESYFRALERTVLADQLRSRHLVVATGGGTFVDPHTSWPTIEWTPVAPACRLLSISWWTGWSGDALSHPRRHPLESRSARRVPAGRRDARL